MLEWKRMKTAFLVLPLILLLIGQAACLPLLAPPLPPLTSTPAPPTQTATATVVWFPATATNTPFPTPTLPVTPTLDTRPGYGGLLFTDDFSDTQGWTQGQTGSGLVAFGKNELTLAVTRERGYLTSQRRNTKLSDFYLEITATPTICRGQDEYGLLLRTNGAGNLYRFSLTCDGRARLDRLYQGQASSPQPLQYFGTVPPGAPSQSRLAVQAQGRELSFYANDGFLFMVREPTLPSGGLGVFSRAAGPDVVTVSFSNLQVYEVKP